MSRPNRDPVQKELKIHKVLSSLIQPLSEKDYEDLQLELIEYGCIHPIQTWNGYILDGHKRYQICRHYGIPYETQKMHLVNLADAISGICSDQLKREDLTCERRRYLIGKWCEAQRQLAVWDVKLAMAQGNQIKLASAAHLRSKKIADALRISLATVYKYQAYQKAMDAILSASPEIGNKILLGKIQISQENARFLGERSSGEIRMLSQMVLARNMDYLSHEDILRGLRSTRHVPSPGCMEERHRENIQVQAQIKNMPVFDPDAEVSSLAFTIPSWCSTIGRTQRCANLKCVSAVAKMRLIGQLETLKAQADVLLNSLKE